MLNSTPARSKIFRLSAASSRSRWADCAASTAPSTRTPACSMPTSTRISGRSSVSHTRVEIFGVETCRQVLRQLQRQIRALAREVATASAGSSAMRSGLDALAGERVLGDRLVAEMLERRVFEPVRGPCRVDQVAGDHRVEGKATERHAVPPDHHAAAFRSWPTLATRASASTGPSTAITRLEFQPVARVEQRAALSRHRDVRGRARRGGDGHADDTRAQRRGAIGDDVQADAAGLRGSWRPAPRGRRRSSTSVYDLATVSAVGA